MNLYKYYRDIIKIMPMIWDVMIPFLETWSRNVNNKIIPISQRKIHSTGILLIPVLDKFKLMFCDVNIKRAVSIFVHFNSLENVSFEAR